MNITSQPVSGTIQSPNTSKAVTEGRVAALGIGASVAALFAAAACCVLPLVLAALGIGAIGLSALVPLHWPLTIVAIIAVGIGWVLYIRRARSCARDTTCSTARPTRATLFALLCASALVGASAMWGYIEAPLMRVVEGA